MDSRVLPRHRLGPLVQLSLTLSALSCSAALREVPRGQHPIAGGAYPVVVDSAPPPAEIETPRPAPDDSCSWADGSWSWEEARWSWQPGRWVRVENGCYYADPLIVWVPAVARAGVLFYTHGQWYQPGGQGQCPLPEPCEPVPSGQATPGT